MNFDKDYLKKRLQHRADDLIKDLTDSYYEDDELTEFDDIAMADVIFSMISDITNDEQEMDKLLNIYMYGLKRSREVHAVRYRDFKKYKLVIYNRDFDVQIGDIITVTILDQRDGGNNPRDFDIKVIQLPDGETPGIGETGNLNIGFTLDTVKALN